jgi:hypothetical protein
MGLRYIREGLNNGPYNFEFVEDDDVLEEKDRTVIETVYDKVELVKCNYQDNPEI